MLVRMEEEFGEFDNTDQTLIEYAIINMAEEIMGEFMEVWGLRKNMVTLCFCFSLKIKEPTLKKNPY